MRIPHLPFNLRLGNQGGDRIDHDHTHSSAADEHLRYLKRLLTGIRLRNQQIVDIYPETPGVGGIQRVLGIDEGGYPSLSLSLGYSMQCNRGFSGGFRPVDLDDAAARESPHSQREVQSDGAGRDHGYNELRLILTQPHHRSLAELALDLAERYLQRLLSVHPLPPEQ